jgi:3-phosphoshikimate 1-carboxyvinyltransferase
MQEIIAPARAIEGIIGLPGDKSISHRYAMLAAIAEGETTIANYSTGADCQSTLACVEALGAKVERRKVAKVADDGGESGANGTKVGDDANDDGQIIIAIRGGALNEPLGELDAGNSGSTIRMLSGILAAQPFTSRIGGDESLSRRPMQRIMTPLAQMGASIEARDGKFPPLVIHGRGHGRGHGRPLHGIDYTLPVPSAQVKSCVLLAGLNAEGDTIVREPVRTRDHTEIALREFGADIETERRVITLRGGAKLTGRELGVPGDLSSAAFFLVAALLMPEANLVIHGVGLNPTRAALLDFLMGMGASIKILDLRQVGGELIGDVRVRASKIAGGVIEGAMTAALIDEIPALAVLGAASSGGLTVRDASELRVKETDRIAVLEENFRRMGVAMEATPDGFHIAGGQRFRAAELDSAGDHRIAMAFAVAALAADGPSTIQGAEAAAVSFPEFFAILRQISG